MKLVEALTRFLDQAAPDNSTDHPHVRTSLHYQSLSLLTEYFAAETTLSDVTPSSIRDFLSRWYVERLSGSRLSRSAASPTAQDPTARLTDVVPEPLALLDSIDHFLRWADEQAGADQSEKLSPILNELRHSIPRALEITDALTTALRGLGGAFNFPEFLTSFEEGGSSQYDIDVPGNIGALDGYFRIVRAEGSLIEAEERISEERVWPIAFPADVAALLDDEYILNLELVRKPEAWQIAACGFAYPPGTEI